MIKTKTHWLVDNLELAKLRQEPGFIPTHHFPSGATIGPHTQGVFRGHVILQPGLSFWQATEMEQKMVLKDLISRG